MTAFDLLEKELEGELHLDEVRRRLYATDASAYRELPIAVAIPKSEDDIVKLVNFARENQMSLIPRTAGTSLAGQVVGSGIVVDISQNFDRIIELNVDDEYVVVEPGIVRDDLNKYLQSEGYFFAPETSTANRAMIGGMIGNNSCGANSVVYGSAREHLLEATTILSDGTKAWFGPVDDNAFIARCNGQGTSGDIHTETYRTIKEILMDEENQKSIHQGFPDRSIPRRNTGYALDLLLNRKPFRKDGDKFNFCSLLAGSEGTLAFITQVKLKISKLPPDHKRLVCIHCDSIDQSLRANLVALKYGPGACELMDHYILDATKRSLLYRRNRFFVSGDPKAILVVELIRSSEKDVDKVTEELIRELEKLKLGYAFPVVKGEDMAKVWGLRKAGLGLLSNVPGDAKPVPVIEDTAVKVQELPEYISEFNQILEKQGMYSVHYAHAGSGELHLRPILDLKQKKGRKAFRKIAEEIAQLVKKYNGSLSGEHGDGRLRGEFIPFMLGDHNYELFKEVKKAWDPYGIFNPGKITETPPMDSSLRFDEGQQTPEVETIFDFSATEGFVRTSEQCNGSGDCRKTHLTGGTMCPSYMATRDEKDTTRARANILREIYTKSETKPAASSEIKEVLDLCLSCKGCKSECPSNVDMGKMKAEWTQTYYNEKGIPFRTRLVAFFSKGMAIASHVPWIYNFTFRFEPVAFISKKILGFATGRSMPQVYRLTLRKWFNKHTSPKDLEKSVYLFCDEFTDLNDSPVGQKAVLLLERLGYGVRMIQHSESGRTYLSKGFLIKARDIARQNIAKFKDIIDQGTPLIGIEPSAILTFRDEYIDLLRDDEKEIAKEISKNVFTIEEFLASELDKGNISPDAFSKGSKTIKVHGHCHQKSLSSLTPTKKILSLPENFKVEMIPSGCCGMAGSFGYEKEHFQLANQIGELVLFPAVRGAGEGVIIAASGTSCRHQIKDGTGINAYHPVEILHDALV